MNFFNKLVLQILAIVTISSGCAGITYLVKGEPKRYLSEKKKRVTGEDISTPEGFISMDQIFTKYEGKVIWIDGRSRNQWQSDGVAGSLFVSTDPREDFGQLLDDAVPVLFKAEQNRVPIVIYCANKGCSDSKLVAEKVRELDLGVPVFQLHGGFGRVLEDSRVKKKNR